MDLHKYGYATKGACIIAFATRKLRRYTYTPVTDWNGGYYVTNTMQGSRNGGIIAAAWSTLVHMGADGYAKAAAVIHGVQTRLVAEVPRIPGLKLFTTPDVCVVPVVGDGIDTYTFASRLSKRGWSVSVLQRPPCFHITCTERLAPILDDLLADMRDIAADMRAHPSSDAKGVAGACQRHSVSTALTMHKCGAMPPRPATSPSLPLPLQACTAPPPCCLRVRLARCCGSTRM